jgi:signal transduction histidine kinase
MRDVTVTRRQLAAALPDADPSSSTAPVTQGASERLLLCLEELASNALRHGRPPVQVRVSAFDRFWLLEVDDGAADTPPIPAVGRDAAEGGLGLHLVARICGSHGWTVSGTGKTTWARIDHSRDDIPREDPAWLPPVHGGSVQAAS